VQCSAVQCRAVCSAVQCSAVQCSAVQCSAVQCSAVQCSAVQCCVRPSHCPHFSLAPSLPCPQYAARCRMERGRLAACGTLAGPTTGSIVSALFILSSPNYEDLEGEALGQYRRAIPANCCSGFILPEKLWMTCDSIAQQNTDQSLMLQLYRECKKFLEGSSRDIMDKRSGDQWVAEQPLSRPLIGPAATEPAADWPSRQSSCSGSCSGSGSGSGSGSCSGSARLHIVC
jgi:hypothetical protein